MLRTEGLDAFVRAWESQPLFVTQRQTPAQRLARQHRRRLSQDPVGLAGCLASLGLGEMPDTRDAIARFPGRLDWIVGALDRRFLEIGREIARLRPATRLHVLEGVGHNPLIEAPDALAALVAQSHSVQSGLRARG